MTSSRAWPKNALIGVLQLSLLRTLVPDIRTGYFYRKRTTHAPDACAQLIVRALQSPSGPFERGSRRTHANLEKVIWIEANGDRTTARLIMRVNGYQLHPLSQFVNGEALSITWPRCGRCSEVLWDQLGKEIGYSCASLNTEGMHTTSLN